MKDHERDSVLLIGFAIIGVIVVALLFAYIGLILIETLVK